MIHKFKLLLENSQCINKIDVKYSKIYNRTNGLPQGGISSPILFNIYINDLIHDLNATNISIPIIPDVTLHNLLFADDIVSFADTAEKLHSLLTVCNRHLDH